LGILFLSNVIRFPMTFRKIISLSISLSFIVLSITGILSYFNVYSRVLATLHTIFGLVFIVGILFHFKNNFGSIKRYSKGKIFVFLTLAIALFFFGVYYQLEPFKAIMDFGAKLKATDKQELNHSSYEMIEMNTEDDLKLTIDVLRAEHYWHPQMAIWTEDMRGNYLQTLFVSKATANGLFFGGRSKENFKDFDAKKKLSGDYRRVNALPIWSHKRGVQYEDGLYVPTNDDPLSDAISGATITDNFILKTSTNSTSVFKLKIELNVAFDDNEYYSEYDFPDDEIFHNGTGQLGQPSIVFDTQIDMKDGKNYYLMELIGHGHRSGQTGELFEELNTLTTAKQIVERIIVGVH